MIQSFWWFACCRILLCDSFILVIRHSSVNVIRSNVWRAVDVVG